MDLLKVVNRPIAAVRDWQLSSNQYDNKEFRNVPIADFNLSSCVMLCPYYLCMSGRKCHMNNCWAYL